MTVGTQTLTTEVKRKFKSVWKRQSWPEPQNSIDFPCGTLGGLLCWTVRGEAKRLFAEIEDGIKSLLQDRMDDIADCQHSLETFGWCMYMMGRDEAHAEPVLLFECLDGKTLAKVINIVKKSQHWKKIIEKYPALRLASNSRGPQGSCFTVDMLENSDGSNAIYCDGPLHQLYGVQIYVNSFRDSSHLSFRKATLGGLILIDDVIHAMTVAHLFKDAPRTETRLDEASNAFAFEDDSEMEDDVSVDITSRGSVSPKSIDSSPDHNDSSMESESTSLFNINSLTMDSPIANTIDSELYPPEEVPIKNHLGFLMAMSNNALDWAIFPIEGEFANLMTSVVVPTEDGDVPLNISQIADSEPISDEIWAITASNGPVKGRLSTVPYHLKSPGSKTFQRTWMTYLETDVAPGASGTWIVDCWTHELVGQVVARQPDSKLAYVVPASFIKNDIESQLDCNVSLPASRSTRNNALHQAAEKGTEDIIRRLLERGADIESLHRGYTALHLAAEIGHENVVRSLLELGANAEAKTWGQDRTALHLAAQSGHANVIRLLLARGPNIDGATGDGSTALHLAAQEGYAHIVQFLVEQNVNVNTQTKDGNTALHLATLKGHADMVRLLAENGANIDATNVYDSTALHCAAEEGYENVVALLIEKGANIHAQNAFGRTALHYAAEGGHEHVVRELLVKAANIESGDDWGDTALDLADRQGRTNIGHLLFERRRVNELDAKYRAGKLSVPLQGPAHWSLPSLKRSENSPVKDQFVAPTSPYTSSAAETGYKGRAKPSPNTEPNIESRTTHSEGVNASFLPMKRREEDIAVNTKRKKRVGYETFAV